MSLVVHAIPKLVLIIHCKCLLKHLLDLNIGITLFYSDDLFHISFERISNNDFKVAIKTYLIHDWLLIPGDIQTP